MNPAIDQQRAQATLARNVSQPALRITPGAAAQRSASLTAYGRQVADQAVTDLVGQIASLEERCRELGALEGVKPGIQQHLRQLSETLRQRGQGIVALHQRR